MTSNNIVHSDVNDTRHDNRPHWSVYTFGFICALIIGIDCAVAAAYYMTLMGGFFAIPIVVAACALSGFILNTILYANDFPSVISELFKESDPNKITQPITLLGTCWTIFQELSALASGVIMGLFTYNAFSAMALAWASPPIVIVFCAAYLIGTYVLMRSAIDLKYNDDENSSIQSKFDALESVSWKVATCLLSTVMIAAAIFTSLSLTAGAATTMAALLIPGVQIAIPVMMTLLMVTEVFLALKTSVWIGHKLHELSQQNVTQLSLRDGIAYSFAILNALGNAAITASGGQKLIALMGFSFSFSVMTRATQELKSQDSPPRTAILASAYIVATLTAAAMISILGAAGISNPLMWAGITALTLFSLIWTIDQCHITFNQYIRNNSIDAVDIDKIARQQSNKPEIVKQADHLQSDSGSDLGPQEPYCCWFF